jgi:hypothetical protein
MRTNPYLRTRTRKQTDKLERKQRGEIGRGGGGGGRRGEWVAALPGLSRGDTETLAAGGHRTYRRPLDSGLGWAVVGLVFRLTH